MAGIHPLALDFLTYSDIPFAEGIRIASENGLRRTTLMVRPVGPLVYLDLIGDSDLKRAVARECERREIVIEALDVFVAAPDSDLDDFNRMCETASDLGAAYVIMLAWDPDRRRLADRCHRMVEIADRWQRTVLVEVHRNTGLRTLAEAARFFEEFEIEEMAVELDSLHFFRAGSSISELEMHGSLVARAQLADGAAGRASDEEYSSEAMFHRLVPGAGEFPLEDFVRNLPAGITLGIEVPNLELSVPERTQRSIRELERWMAEVLHVDEGGPGVL